MWEKIISHIAYVVEEDWSWKLSWAENKRKSSNFFFKHFQKDEEVELSVSDVECEIKLLQP